MHRQTRPVAMTTNPTYKGIVYPWHCDHMGHMNVMWYVSKFDEATWGFVAQIGLGPSELLARNQGMAALEQNIKYLREAKPGDLLEIYTKPLEIKNKTIRFVHTMIDCESGETAATCELVGACLDKAARKAIAWPKEVHKKATALISSA